MNSSELSPREQRLIDRKQRSIDALSIQFSHNAMPMEEYERLVEYIHKAESDRELVIIERIVAESALYAGEPLQAASPANTGITDSSRPDLSFFASREISGESLVGKQRSFLSVFGTTTITIGEGQLPPGKTIIKAVSVFGNIVISVPQGIAVTMDVAAILGNATVQRGVETTTLPGGPELVIIGGAYLGNITVEVRKPKISEILSKKIIEFLRK